MKKGVFVAILILIFARLAYSQNSSIQGKVIDGSTGEGIPGASIFIDSTTTGASTDYDGNFIIQNITPGKYRLVCKYISYNTKILSDVVVKNGEPAIISITLDPASKEIGVVEIVATVNRESSNALFIMQKNNATVSDGISAETIKRTPDKSTSDVLKRVSGASIQDNKFAVIRGLNDRYNAAYINGAPLPSSEPDRKAFAFDIFPSNMLENLVIIKTATPELPGEFAGGIIQVTTKNIPENNFQSVSFGSGFNTITTGKEQVYYNGGKLDWLGVDDGTRAMPAEIPDKKDFPIKMDDQAALAQKTNGDWGLYSKKFTPNYNFQYSMGYTKSLKGKPLGFIAALTYNKTNNYNETIRRGYTGNNTSNLVSQIDFDYLDKAYSEQVLSSALANLSLKVNDNNSFSFKNLFSVNSDDKVIARTGETNPLESNPTLLKSTARWFTSNKIYSGQLIGEHYIPASKIKFNWVGSLSQIQREIPNLRRSIYTRLKNLNDPNNPNPSDTVYSANISYSNVGSDYGGGIFYSENKENIYSFKADASYVIPSSEKFRNEIKIGGSNQDRSREFSARQLGYTKYGKLGGNVSFKDSLLYLNENNIFNASNMGLITAPDGNNGVGGFKLTDGTKYSDSYTASSNLTAVYIMFDDKYKSLVRLVWGARLENFSQKLNAVKSDKSDLNLLVNKSDILPSANLILSLSDKQNVRFGYSQTVNRPEFRELAPFAFYDFNTQFVVSGNDSLKRAKIHNYDVRYEVFPGRGQVASASVFYKNFIDPIEQISRPDVTSEISFKNVPNASSFGIEAEFRIILAALFKADSSKVLNNLTAFSNVAIIHSEVNVKSVVGAMAESRPLQGQSPYILNAGLQYFNPELGTSFSASFNKIGQRIYIVGNVGEPDIWESTRSFLDLQITKSVWKRRLEIKFNAQNVLAQNQNFYQKRAVDATEKHGFISKKFSDSNTRYDKNTDDLIWATKYGKVYSLGISMKF